MPGCTNCGRAAAQGCQCFVVSGNPNVVVAGDGTAENPYTISVTGDCDCNGVESVVDNGDGTMTVTLDNGDTTTITLPVGPQGPQGDVGPVGATGAQGEPGEQGPAGVQGPAGEDGAQGPAGEQGDPGPAGDPGPQGDPGPAGEQGPAGDPGPAGPAGVGVAAVTDNGDGTFTFTLTDDTVTDPVATIPGQQGPAGEQGPAGDAGPAGEPGVDGVSVVDANDNGDGTFTLELSDGTYTAPVATIPGEQGPQGVKGDAGAQGVPGEPGEQGPAGEDGAQGPAGEQGPQGDPGPANVVTGSDPVTVTPTDNGDGTITYDVAVAVATDHGADGTGTAADPVTVVTPVEWGEGETADLESVGGQTQDGGVPVFLDSTGALRTPSGLYVLQADQAGISAVPADSPLWNDASILLGDRTLTDVRALAIARALGTDGSGISKLTSSQLNSRHATRMAAEQYADPADTAPTLTGSLLVRADSQLATTSRDGVDTTITRPLPFAFAQGLALDITGTTGNVRSRTVTLPVNRFTAAPLVTVQIGTGASGTTNTEIWVDSRSTTSFRINLIRTGSGGDTTVSLMWIAIQDAVA